ncbi:MAG: hypothetical protein GYB35_17325 [Algicola sp.]|nr:hypothetical protein [Algicola sp.]
MKYLAKYEESEILTKGLDYKVQSQRPEIKKLLINEQKQFCAYSERFIKNTDSVHIEHFDGRIKSTAEDNYNNWYAVMAWFNEHKPKKIDPFLPFLEPLSADLKERIKYEDGIYKINRETDVEAENLIKYLGFNKQELFSDRQKHIKRINELFEMLGNDVDALKEQFIKHKDYLSFATAIEVELNIELDDLIFE